MEYTRKELEQIAFDMASDSMQYNGEDHEIWEDIKRTDSETLLNYILLE